MNETLERPRQIRKFNPGTFQSDEEVISQFVVRNRELGTVLDVLRGNIGSPSCQHVLLIAPRGRGKTMMLARVAAELRTDREFSERLLPVRFMEESQEIFNLADFWLESLFYLAREHVTRDLGLSQELRDVHAALAAEWQGRELEERARAAVLETADRLGRQLVLMVENLQALCGDVDDDFGWQLRKALQSESQIILLATATSRFKELDNAQHAFFELFRIVRLDPLDTGECRRLWQMVNGDAVSEREIRPLQILTGGDPRLLIIIGEFARHRSLRQLMEELVRLIDDHTEYFRGHLEVFAKAERRVYLAVIDLWQPSTTGEIASRARMGVRAVSALLGRLVERGAVIVEGNGKRRMYAAAQRLYSIYYKLRRERDEAAIVRNLIHFMVVFYTKTELAEMAGRLSSEAAQWPAIREGIKRAIAEAPQIGRIFSGEEWQSIRQASEQATATDDKALVNGGVTQGQIGEAQGAMATYNEVVERFGDSDVPELQAQVAEALVNRGVTQGRSGEAQGAMATYDEVVERFGDSDVPELQVQVAMALFNRGVTQGRSGEAQEAMATYDEVVERFGDSDMPELQVQVAKALANKAITQGQIGEAQGAMATCDKVVERFGDIDVPELQVSVAMALFNRGVTQGRSGEAQGAMATYDEVVERFGDSDVPELQVHVAMALFNRAITQGQIGEAQAEMATYDEVVERFGNSDMPELQVPVAEALVNRGVTQGQIGEAQGAMATYDEVVGRFGDSDVPELQVRVAKALVNRGVTQEWLGETESGVVTYDEVVERFGDSDVPELQVQVARALVNRGVTQGQSGEVPAAMATCDEVVERFGDSDMPELQVQVAKALVNRGVTQGQSGEAQGVMATCDEVVERFGDSDMPELQVQVAKALVNRGVTQGQSGEAQGVMATCDEVVERFGDSDVPELQVQVAQALVHKAVTQGQVGEAQGAMATCDEVVERFGDSDVPELQVRVAQALVHKAITQGQIGEAQAAITTCDKAVACFKDSDAPEITIQVAIALGVKTEALLVREDPLAAMETFRSMYAAFVPGHEIVMRWLLALVPDLIAAGASERELVEVLSSDSEKADTIVPLVVALRQRTGEVVRAPGEVLEVAADIRERIEAKVGSGDTVSPGTPSV